jgi:hypothetical protein
VAALSLMIFVPAQSPATGFLPGQRSVMDAHNCYPYGGRWNNRIDRALSAGTPLAIEQDLYWYTDQKTGKSWSVVSHGKDVTGHEPTIEHYFFDRVRPVVEKALREGNHGNWPLITLNLDFKEDNPALLEAVWNLLEKYQGWITTGTKTTDIHTISALTVKPILVLAGESDSQQSIFYDRLPVGAKLLAFGAVHSHNANPMAAPDVLDPKPENNYRRWWNNPWNVVEAGGQPNAGAWTPADNQRLISLVNHAHGNHLWIRFYTLDGATSAEAISNGWFKGYNFGSLKAAELRWRAAQQDGVDFIATDQYELLGRLLKDHESSR